MLGASPLTNNKTITFPNIFKHQLKTYLIKYQINLHRQMNIYYAYAVLVMLSKTVADHLSYGKRR